MPGKRDPKGREDVADIEALVKRVGTSTPSARDVQELRAVLKTDAGRALTALADRGVLRELVNVTTSNEAVRAVIWHEVESLRERYGLVRAEGLERALLEHLVTCYVRLQLAEHALTQKTSDSHSHREGAYRERRLSEAQGRYLRALALVDRMRRRAPSVQVNIAAQQIVQNTGPAHP